MVKKDISFKITKIGETSNGKLFAVISSEKPVSTMGALAITGRAIVYRVEINSLPEGVDLNEKRNDGKAFSKDLDKLDEFVIPHVKLSPMRPYEPVGYEVEEKEVTRNDGNTSYYKWIILTS